MKAKFFLVLAFSIFLSFYLHPQNVLSFPGAEGCGRFTTGGRGGTVYYVTNLTDVNSGNAATHEGSLRWCLSQNGTKTILFKVSGTIFLTSNLSINKPNLTIAGQSAPGDGICIAGFPVVLSADNIIIRFIRMRMGDKFGISADGADAFGARGYKNIIIDHCSMSWSTDECVSVYGNQNSTVQWCLISESLRLSKHSKGPHGYGGIWGGKNASFHHNLLAHHDSRTPRFGPAVNTQNEEATDMRNCVIYNWSGNGCYGAEAMKVNIVNNYYKPGPATPSGSKRGRIIAIDKKTGLTSTDDFYPINNLWGKFYIDGNVIDESTSSNASDKTVCRNATSNNWDYGVYNQIASSYGITADEKIALKSETPVFDPGTITLHSAQKAYEKVIAYAGASLVRDTLDNRIIAETISGTAAFKGLSPYNGLGSVTYPAGTVLSNGEILTVATTIDWKSVGYPKGGIIDSENDIKPSDASSDWSPWPELKQSVAPIDQNVDGIPDDWLVTRFPGKSANDLNENGYTYLEVYLNSLVDSIVSEGNKDAITSGVVLIGNDLNKPTIKFNSNEKKLLIFHNQLIKKIEIFNVSGIKVQTKNTNFTAEEVDLQSLSSGVYILLIYVEGCTKPFAEKFMNPF